MTDLEEIHLSSVPAPGESLILIDESKPHGRTLWAICPYCKEGRYIPTWHIENNWTTTACSRHRNMPRTKWATPGEFDTRTNVIVDYTNQKIAPVGQKRRFGNPYRAVHIMGTCPDCKNSRWVLLNGLRSNHLTTLCPSCAGKRRIISGPANHNWKGGTQITNGYRELHRLNIPSHLLPLLEEHIGNRAYYYEHRVVALATYGPQAIAPGMVVRHLDGDKLNNKPSNLAYGPQSANIRDHVTDRKELKKWRRIAEKLAKELAELRQQQLKL